MMCFVVKRLVSIWLFLIATQSTGVLALSLPRTDASARSQGGVVKGPVLSFSPPSKLSFSNSTGASIPCSAGASNPAPIISWTTHDGRPIHTVPGILELSPNGTLVFPPFAPHQYDTTVHDAVFRCKATSGAGSVLSRPVQVRGVVVGDYEVQAYDQLVMVGNTGVLRCSVPSYVTEYVTVTSWLHDSAFNIYPSLHGDGKYHMTPSGELLVLNVGPQDGHSRFQCRTLHTLTGSTQLSTTPARIIVTEPQGSVPPRISERAPKVTAASGSDVMLPCVAQGHPSPQYSWFHGLTPVLQSERAWAVGGSLVLVGVSSEDSGEYHCVANNSAGTSRYTTHLSISTHLSVQINPNEIEVDFGRNLELNCHISGQPIDSVAWYKDSVLIRPNGRVRIRPKETLQISPVDKMDSGVYQCEANSGTLYASDQAYVSLGASAPSLAYRFISQTLKPGPSVSLKCIATGTPTPQISWTLDGFQLPQSHRFLIGQYVSGHGDVISHVNISSVRVSDGGSYRCEATNVAGSIAHQARLNIYGTPQVRVMGRDSAVAGEDFQVTCPVGGHPIDKIVWKKDGVRLPANHRQRAMANGTLDIRKVSRGIDDGVYSCTAFDKQGRSHTQALTLSVIVAPLVLPFYLDTGLMAGERVGVACIVSKGDPPMSITWLKDGVPLDQLSLSGLTVTSGNEFSSTLMISNLSWKHSGNYTCKASNDWANSMHTAGLKVNVPPRLAPFVFPEGTRAGMRTQAACFLQEGDQPIALKWEKDGEPLESLPDVRITQMDPFTSVLILEKVTAQHTGNYSCLASNAVRTAQTTAALTVRVPPEWITEPIGSSVSLGGTVSLQCLAKGFPDPKISWKKETVSGEFVPVGVDMSMGVRAWENGTLSFSRVERRHEGRFLCEANNGVGGGLSKVISLQVNEPPWFALRSQRLQVEVDSLAKLTCQAKGDPPLNIIWTRDGAPLPPYPRYEVSERESEGGTSSELLIRRAQVQDSGTFVCEASNPHGTLTSDFHLVVQDVPYSPAGLIVVEKGSRHMTLTWTPTSDSNAPIMAYIVSYYPQWAERKGLPREVTVDGDEVRVRIEDLFPATTYSFSVAAENRVGRSPHSPSIMQSTLEEAPKGTPRNVRVSAISPAALQVSWDPPHDNETYGLILGYYLGYKDDSYDPATASVDAGAYNFTTIGVEGLGVTSATLTSLSPFTKYAVVVQAFNSRGAGPSTSPSFATTLEDKPGAPPNKIACDSLTSKSLKISWSPPSQKANGKVISYRVTFRLENPKEEHDGSGMIISEGLDTTLTDLEPWSNYSVSVAASTRAGEGVASPPLTCTTLEDVPDAPDRLKVIASGIRSAIASWSVPQRPNGKIIGYTVHWVPSGNKTQPLSRYVESPQTHLTLHDLSSSSNEVWVTASTSVGKGPLSNVVVVTPTKKVAAGVWSVGGNVTVGWKDDVQMPCRTLGKPEPEITWSHLGKPVPSKSDRVTHLPDGSLRIVDTQKGDSGSYACRASNIHGSDSVIYNLKILVPPSRPFLHVTETTSSSIRLQWSVDDDGGAPIRKSILYFRPTNGETEEVEVIGSRTSHTVGSLRCGTSHHFFVTTTNRIGTSDASKEVEARTKGRPPEAPPLFQFVTTNSSQATLYLTQWESGGCDITHFLIQYRLVNAANTWTTVGSEIKPSRTFAVSGLTSGKKYQIRVRAFNAAGSTTEDYLVTTPSTGKSAFRETLSDGDGWNMVVDDGESSISTDLWEDPRIMVPAVVSFLAILLTIATVCICLKKKSISPDNHKKGVPDEGCAAHPQGGKGDLMEEYQIYSSNRRPPPTPPNPPPPSEARDSAGDFSEDDVYQYATTTYQIRRVSPPPPAPSSPMEHSQTHRRSHQKGFSALVYQPPSLHDVDAPNMGGRCSVPPDSYAHGEVSETDEYGSLADGETSKQRQQRLSRNRNHKTRYTSGTEVEPRKTPVQIRDSPKSFCGRPVRFPNNTLRPKARLPSPINRHFRDSNHPSTHPSEAAECDIPW